jgi:hypothetical protein
MIAIFMDIDLIVVEWLLNWSKKATDMNYNFYRAWLQNKIKVTSSFLFS